MKTEVLEIIIAIDGETPDVQRHLMGKMSRCKVVTNLKRQGLVDAAAIALRQRGSAKIICDNGYIIYEFKPWSPIDEN